MELSYDKTKLAETAKQYGLKFVIVHGSYATSQHIGGQSDLDIAILERQDIDFDALMKLHGDLSDIFGASSAQELDLKSLKRVDPLFRYQVVKSGKLLYGDPTDYEAFKAYAYRAYDDAKPLFDLERELVRKYQHHLKRAYAR